MQNILITGGNAGVGKATAIGLAQKQHRIIIWGRNQAKIKAAVEDIKSRTDNKEIYGLIGDLASFESIIKSTDKFKADFGKLDILINNAGVAADKPQLTEDGFELQIGVNHLGHFLLTSELLDLIKASSSPRIINVSSDAHYRGKINFDSFRGESRQLLFNGMTGYAQSKLANVLFTKELARRYPAIITHSLHPGVVQTQIAYKNDNSRLWKSLWKLAEPLMISPAKGAKTSIFLAESEEVLKGNGRYYNKCKEKAPSQVAKDQELAEKLWAVSEELVGN